MNPKHETKSALQPIEQGAVVVCANHQQTVSEIYEKISASTNSKMSRSQIIWIVALLMSVGAAYGGLLWATTSNANTAVVIANADNAKNIMEIDRRVLTLELRWQQVQVQMDRIETDQKILRTELNAQLEGIRRLVQEKKL